ncbi:MAG: putative porin [Nitrospirae bacterium]|nr:putative porin [Nitrospirota bacterium]
MKQVIGLVGVLGMLAGLSTPVVAADKVPLKELLVQKGTITMEEAATVQDSVWAKWVDRVTFSGDLRIRDEQFWYSAVPGTNDDRNNRNRVRFRLRFGSQIKIKDLLVVVRLASGTGEAVSTNQTFDNLFTQKSIWIDQAYLSWNPAMARWATISAGRMQNPFVRFYSSDIVWDDDVNPEGIAEQLQFKSGGTVLFVNLAQLVLDEDGPAAAPSTDGHEQWMIAQQVGVTVEPSSTLKATLAGAFYEVLNGTKGTFSQNPVQDGNTRAAGILVNRYHILDLTAALNVNAGPLPLAIMADYVRNLADTVNAAGTAPTGNVGYQVGAILGKASDPNTFELAYFYKVAETDATLADLADSDFGDGGINRRGHIVWVAYNPAKYFQAKAKMFVTTSDGPLKDDITRLQVDFSTKF